VVYILKHLARQEILSMAPISSRLLTLSLICLATSVAAQAPHPSPTTTAIKSIETTTAVIKDHPECLAKIDVVTEDAVRTIQQRVDIIKNDIPRDERKVIEKAVKDEANLAFKSIKKIIEHHADNIKNKVDATIGADKRKQLIDDLDADTENLDAKATEIGLRDSFKKLGKDIKAAFQKKAA
jgi:hypothetical protein